MFRQRDDLDLEHASDHFGLLIECCTGVGQLETALQVGAWMVATESCLQQMHPYLQSRYFQPLYLINTSHPALSLSTHSHWYRGAMQ